MTAPWKPDGTGVVSGLQTGSGDELMDAHGVRFIHTELPGRLFTIDFYAANRNWRGEDQDQPVVFEVHSCAELMVCRDITDPGGTEEWCDYVDRDEPGTYPTVEDADNAAAYLAHTYTADQITWDGLAPWEES